MDKNLSKNEWIGIVVAVLATLILFFGLSNFNHIFGRGSDQGQMNTDEASYMGGEIESNMINNKDINNQNNNMSDSSNGVGAKIGDRVIVHYTGKFTDGKVFDSSIPRGQAFPVDLGSGQVIAGWEEGLIGVVKGQKLTLTIPPEKAYGEGYPDGRGGYIIPPNATLIFDIEVVDVISR